MTVPILATSGTDPWEHWSFVATIFAAIWAAVWAVKQFRDETARRRTDQEKERESKQADLRHAEQELRWKQAKLARKMMDAIFDYDPSNDAWRMVDGEEQGYKDSQGNQYHITIGMVDHALRVPWTDDSGGPEVYVRWCFDALFYYLEQIEHSIQLGHLRFEDVEASAGYYVALMGKNGELKERFQKYAEVIRFRRAVQFLEGFPDWREKKALVN
jgi:hypothetical protein